MTKKIVITFICILALAAVLRLFALGTNPPEMTWDEVAWGYNAYALGIDGRDEFGKRLPIQYLESFGDYKPPVYAYLDILPVKILGLTVVATRLPSALAGIGAVYMTFFLVLRLFPQSKNKYLYALASSFLLAISPWHILLSRAAFEANVATFFIILAMWAFLTGLQERKWLLPVSAVLFVVPFYTFNSPRAFLPLFIIALAIGLWRKLWDRKTVTSIAIGIGVILLAPLVPFLLSPQGQLRYQEVNIFTDPQIVKMSNQEIVNDHNSLWSKFLHNRRFLYTRDFLQHYFDNLNPSFLFFTGDPNPKFSIQTTGELYMWCLPFFIAGFFILFRKREGYWWIIPIWLVLGIIPAATAEQTPHALRTEVVLPTVQILIAYAFVWFALYTRQKVKTQKAWYLPVAVTFIFALYGFVHFTNSYFTHYATEYSVQWQYGYKQSIAYVMANQQKYDQIDITDSLGRPYIYYLFYMHVDPRVYRADATITRDVFGFVTVSRFGKYYFGNNLTQINNTNKKVLFINIPNNVPKNARVLQTFYALDKTPVFVAYTE